MNPLKAVCLQATATEKEQRLTQKWLFTLRHTLSKAQRRGWGFPSCSVDSGPLCMEEGQAQQTSAWVRSNQAYSQADACMWGHTCTRKGQTPSQAGPQPESSPSHTFPCSVIRVGDTGQASRAVISACSKALKRSMACALRNQLQSRGTRGGFAFSPPRKQPKRGPAKYLGGQRVGASW